MLMFEHRQTVRLVGMGTPSQRRTLWEVRLKNKTDYGSRRINICRVDDDTCSMWVPRKFIQPATVLDLMVAD